MRRPCAAPQPGFFVVQTTQTTETLDKGYRGFSYLSEHLARNGFISVSVAFDAYLFNLAANDIDGREKIANEYLNQLSAGVGVPNILAGQLDFSDISLIGHSRGGSVVPNMAFQLNGLGGKLRIKRGVSVSPPDLSVVSAPMEDADYLLLYGAYDRDAFDGGAFKIYDRGPGQKFLCFIDKANHKFFNRSSGLDDTNSAQFVAANRPLDVRPREQHEQPARAYIGAFLFDSFTGKTKYRDFLLRDASHIKPPSVLVPAAGISFQSLSVRSTAKIVDDYTVKPGDQPDKTKNTLGGSVSGTNLKLFDKINVDGTMTILPVGNVNFQLVPLNERNYYQDPANWAGVVEFKQPPKTTPLYLQSTEAAKKALDVSKSGSSRFLVGSRETGRF